MIDGNNRGKNVSLDVSLQNLRGITHPDRQRCGIIDHHIPGSAFQRVQLSVAVADQLLDLTRQLARMAFATIERSNLVSAAQRVSNLVWPGESGAAKNKNAQRLHGFLCEQRCRRYSERKHACGRKFDEMTASCVHLLMPCRGTVETSRC